MIAAPRVILLHIDGPAERSKSRQLARDGFFWLDVSLFMGLPKTSNAAFAVTPGMYKMKAMFPIFLP